MGLGSFLDNNSRFGRLMWRCGVLIGCNLLFVALCFPVVTAGAGYAAMHYTLLKFKRANGQIRFFRTWWQGFKENWKQATAAWLLILLLAAALGLEYYWCCQFTGPMAWFRYGILALLFLELVAGLYIFPVMVAFSAPLKTLAGYGLMFAAQRPVNLLLILAANVIPFVVTYTFPEQMPTWAFLWCMFGFAAVARFTDGLLLKQFIPHLPKVDAAGDIIPDELLDDPNLIMADGAPSSASEDEAKTLAEMRKYGL